MLPSTKPSLHKETMGSYSSAVIGIIVVTLAITIGLSVLGVWVNANNGIPKDDFALPFIPEKNPLSEIFSQEIMKNSHFGEIDSEVLDGALKGLCDGSAPESGSCGPFDTVRGELKVVDSKLPSMDDKLPLCITNEWLLEQGYYVTVKSVGGYMPECVKITVDQNKDNVIEGYIYGRWTVLPKPDGECCSTTYYKFTFYVCKPICLDSNHLPLGIEPDKTLGKEVFVDWESKWSGCELDFQEFMVMLAHKAMSQNPKLPIIKTSPV